MTLTTKIVLAIHEGHLLEDSHGYRAGTGLSFVYWAAAHPAASEEERARARAALRDGFSLEYVGPPCGGLASVPFDAPRKGSTVAALRRLGEALLRPDILLRDFGLRKVE